MKYEPYNFESFRELVKWAYNQEWYTGRRQLFQLTCEGEFEGFKGRATEAWECQFRLVIDEPKIDVLGWSVKEVCDKALKLIEEDRVAEPPK